MFNDKMNFVESPPPVFCIELNITFWLMSYEYENVIHNRKAAGQTIFC